MRFEYHDWTLACMVDTGLPGVIGRLGAAWSSDIPSWAMAFGLITFHLLCFGLLLSLRGASNL
jgi:hypothetical protein